MEEMRGISGIGRSRRRRAMFEAEIRPCPDFEGEEPYGIAEDLETEVLKRIIRREIEEGVRTQIEQLESEGGPPLRERQ